MANSDSEEISTPVILSKIVEKLPDNLWVRVSELIKTYQPVNLASGYPDFHEVVPQVLKEALVSTQQGNVPAHYNQYPRSQGHPLLTQELATLYSNVLRKTVDPQNEVLITVGADEALVSIIRATVNSGEEVIILEPFYTLYQEAVIMCCGIAKFVPLKLKTGGTCGNDFVFDEEELKAAFTPKTKAIIVNSPHNPTGKIFTLNELSFIADLCKKHNSLFISDEVYERLYYDDADVSSDGEKLSLRIASIPGMWERSVTIGSAGKSFGVTGWKVGWMIGPKYLISAAQAIHVSTVFCVAGPLQIALAAVLKEEKEKLTSVDSYWHNVRSMLTKKRNRLYQLLTDIGLKPILPQGGYFMLADVSGIHTEEEGLRDVAFVEWLIKEKGVAAIPVSSFCSSSNKCDNLVRFCFIKADETLDAAAEKMKSLTTS